MKVGETISHPSRQGATNLEVLWWHIAITMDQMDARHSHGATVQCNLVQFRSTAQKTTA